MNLTKFIKTKNLSFKEIIKKEIINIERYKKIEKLPTYRYAAIIGTMSDIYMSIKFAYEKNDLKELNKILKRPFIFMENILSEEIISEIDERIIEQKIINNKDLWTLAQATHIYRSGLGQEELSEGPNNQVLNEFEDVKSNLLKIIDKHKKSKIIFNPTFGNPFLNMKADGDFIIDGYLTEIKTSSIAEFKLDYIYQLISYMVLNKINKKLHLRLGEKFKKDFGFEMFEIKGFRYINPRFNIDYKFDFKISSLLLNNFINDLNKTVINHDINKKTLKMIFEEKIIRK